MLVLAVLDETVPMPWDAETMRYVLVCALIGMAGGGAIFGIVSALRNAVFCRGDRQAEIYRVRYSALIKAPTASTMTSGASKLRCCGRLTSP